MLIVTSKKLPLPIYPHQFYTLYKKDIVKEGHDHEVRIFLETEYEDNNHLLFVYRYDISPDMTGKMRLSLVYHYKNGVMTPNG